MKAAILAIVLLCVLAAANATQFNRSDMQKFSDESVGTAAACIQDIMNCVTAALSIVKAAIGGNITGILQGATTIVTNIMKAINDC